MAYAMVAAVALAAVSTFGDWIWAVLRLRHVMWYGLIHGALICFCIGVAIGHRERRVAAGALAGPLVGLLAAGGFYALRPWLGYYGMFPMWMFFWICFALVQDRLGVDRNPGRAIVRGLVAAIVSGLAFYAISGIWTSRSPGGPNYLVNFAAWSIAFLPGFAALFIGRRTRA